MVKQNTMEPGGAVCGAEGSVSKIITKYVFRGISSVIIALCLIWSLYGYRRGLFTSVEALQDYIAGFGVWAAFVFVLLQMLQVVVPILPGGVSSVVGVLLFGPWMGFLYNYIGMSLGSVCAFALSRRFGRLILEHLFSEKTIAKYAAWTEKKSRFPKLFAAAIAFPGMPDDFLCYLAGITSMSWWYFLAVILIGRPITLAAYSLGLHTITR